MRTENLLHTFATFGYFFFLLSSRLGEFLLPGHRACHEGIRLPSACSPRNTAARRENLFALPGGEKEGTSALTGSCYTFGL